jgi:hypothetical protein
LRVRRLSAIGALAVIGPAVLGLSSATATAVPSAARPRLAIAQPPTAADVVAGRFVRRAELDNGAFVVAPAQAGERPPMAAHEAGVLIGSDPTVTGSHGDELLGFGQVSVRSNLGVSLERTPAWVGLVWDGVSSCPLMTIPSGSTTTTSAPPTPGYRAVVIVQARKVFDYASRGAPCGGPPAGPSAQAASETVSVPWAPFARRSCGEISLQSSAPLGPPAGGMAPPTSSYTTITHAPTGPIGQSDPIT